MWVCVLISSSYKGTRLGPTHLPSFYLTSLKACWQIVTFINTGFKTSTVDFGETQFDPQHLPPTDEFAFCLLEHQNLWLFPQLPCFWLQLFPIFTYFPFLSLSSEGFFFVCFYFFPAELLHCGVRSSPVAQLVKNLPAMRKNWVRSLGWEDPLEKETTTHFNILAFRIPWTV